MKGIWLVNQLKQLPMFGIRDMDNCSSSRTDCWVHYFIIIIIKKGQQCKAGENDIHPISPKTPAPQHQPIDRKKRKGNRVEDYSRDRAA